MAYPFRKFINDVHLWLGIGSGFILFIVCLSGSIYTFHTEIDQITNSEKYFVQNRNEDLKSIAFLMSKVEKFSKGKVVNFSLPEKLDESYAFLVKKTPKERRGKKYYINQYTGKVLGNSDSKTNDFFMFFFKMHRWLLLDMQIGRIIVGISTIVFIILCISGLILWFPRKLKRKNIKQGLRIKLDSNWKRINYDLHNTLGFYSLILVLIMALTGLCWSFDWYRNGLGNIIGTKIWERKNEQFISDTLQINSKKIEYEEFVKIAQNKLGYKGRVSISLPKKTEGIIMVKSHNPDKWSPSTPDKVIIDRYTGKILQVAIFGYQAFNIRIANLIRPLHTGEIYGVFSKIIYFIVCLIATSLPITGTIIWINRLVKKRKSRK